ncbi:MAG: hypothetical protein A2Y33_09850 [Spirochaetes bacterium GWF1_51_8]|nr:MAG: hypothetical protein A2Y33_09850 [Spirochaetes bacterium GWF1_51_8]
MSGIPGALIFTSREGLILIDAQKLYPFGNITMHEGVIDIGNARYYHALDYIPEINLYCHSLTPFQRWNDNKENYSFLFHIFLILITIIYTARIFISKVIFIDPVFRLMDDVVKIDIRKKIAFPDPSFHEFTVIREKLSELYQGIRSEISIEKNLKDYYDSIINSSPNLILTTDMNENIVMINQTAVHFFGKGAAQDTKMILDDFFTLSEDERLQFERNKKLTGKTTTILGKKIPKDHKLQVFDVLIYNLTADEEIIGFAFVLIDVTRQSLMEEQLLQTQKMETVGILAGGFAHDFNNLLTIIIGNLDIYRYAKDEAKRAEQIDSVYNASLKASELVKQILNFSRKEDIQVESVIAEDVLMSVVKVVKNSLPKHIKILNNILTESTFVTADAGQLIQACLNIALNARDAIPPERMGKIEISTGIVARRSRELPLLNLDENREYIKISISDNGQGIPDDIRDKIFDPFFSTKERDSIKGRGLGLSVVYGTIQRFHGAIDFESFKDKGTVFNIYLPVSEREPKAAEEPPIPAPAKKLNLLVVDDDANIRKLGQKFLNLLGYESKTAVNGKKAEIVLKENRFDIIILDLIMPEFDGIYFLEHLKKNNIEIPVIITTGHFDEFSRTELGKYTNVKGFIDKPFTLMQFSQAVRDTAKLIP